MEMFGKVVVSSEGDNATIFTGIGSFGWRRRFGWHDVKSIRLYERGSSESGTLEYIQVAADKEYNFASTLSQARRRYMLKVLRKKWQGRGA